MKLSDKPCYPYQYVHPSNQGGLTFRERLIIAVASGDSTRMSDNEMFANNCIEKADAIIKELEK